VSAGSAASRHAGCEGLAELKFSASVYGLGAGLFFLAYALFEVPSSLMLRRYRAPQWISRIIGPGAAGWRPRRSFQFAKRAEEFYLPYLADILL
jgi:hypothetical protein